MRKNNPVIEQLRNLRLGEELDTKVKGSIYGR